MTRDDEVSILGDTGKSKSRTNLYCLFSLEVLYFAVLLSDDGFTDCESLSIALTFRQKQLQQQITSHRLRRSYRPQNSDSPGGDYITKTTGSSAALQRFSWHNSITFRMSRRRREMYCGHRRLCVRLCVCPRPHAHTIARTRM